MIKLRPIQSIKTLYRSPVKTLLTFILLSVVTFAFFSQTAEYAVTSREFNSATRQYCGIGAAEISPPVDSHPESPNYIFADPRMSQSYSEADKEFYSTLPYTPLTQEQISAISALPYITSTDTRYMTAGVSDTFFRLDEEDFYNYSLRCVIEGTLEMGSGQFFLNDCRLLAGNPPSPVDHEKIRFYPGPSNEERIWLVGMRRTFLSYPPNYKYDAEYVQNLTPGGRYVFVTRFNPAGQLAPGYEHDFYMSDTFTDPWCAPVWPVDGELDNYLEMDKFAPLWELVALTNADTHTFDMVYTEDMSAILRFAEGNMAIIDGRALNKEDSAAGSTVCVVSREVAEENQLVVGDKVTMKLGTELFEQYKGLGAVAATRERYTPANKTVTLEIVGIYADMDGSGMQRSKPNWSYSINTVFVPKSLLPVDESQLAGHVFSPAEFSFKVEYAWDIPAFLDEVAPRFGEMGLRLIFDDDGWPDTADAFKATRQLALIKIAVLSAAIAAATGFVVYLFIARKKKEYAVMRALGTARKTAARLLILPLMAVAVLAVLAGSGAAWIYTVKTIAHSNTLSLMKEYVVSTAVPAEAVIGCILGEILLTLIFAILLLRRVGNLSPLSLLQDNVSKSSCGKRKALRKVPARLEAKSLAMAAPCGVLVSMPPEAGAVIETSTVTGDPAPVREIHKKASSGFVLRYIWRHMRRSAGKSALTVLLAALLFGVVGQLALMKQSYAQLCDETVITARFVGGLPITSVPQIAQSVFVKDPYYEAREIVDMNSAETSLVFTNNIARYTGEEADIIYIGGYDASCMEKFGEIIIAGKALMETYGLEPGDTVKMLPRGFVDNLKPTYTNEYRKTHPGDTITDEDILALYQSELMIAINMATCIYTIAGTVSTPSGAYDGMAFTPGDYDAYMAVGKAVKLEVAEFTLADNMRADEFRSNGEKMAVGGAVFVMDTSKLEHLRNTLKLLETMYPIAMTAALLIGGFLCCLVIVQSSKEAAIMRILGTTKRKTRTILALEQMLLSICGLVIGACGLLAYKGAALSRISAQLYVFAALYFAVILVSAIICAGLSTRRNVLELLQTKE